MVEVIRYYGRVLRRAWQDTRQVVEEHMRIEVALVVAVGFVTFAVDEMLVGLAAVSALLAGVVIVSLIMAPVRLSRAEQHQVDANRRQVEEYRASLEESKHRYDELRSQSRSREHLGMLVMEGEKHRDSNCSAVEAQKWADRVAHDLREQLGEDYAQRFQSASPADSEVSAFLDVRIERLHRIVWNLRLIRHGLKMT